jgi:ornithine cyclodeaminase
VLSAQGELLGVISAAEVTAFRTALATMTLFSRCKWLFDSGKKARIIVFGSGRQAEWHARLALLLLPEKIDGITFVNRGQERLDQMMAGLRRDLQQRYPNLKISAYAKSALKAEEYSSRLSSDLAESNVLFCCTPSTEPLFAYDAIATANRDKRFISIIGSYKPHMQEVDKQTLLSGTEGRIYVDSKHACLKEAGELIMAGVQESQLVEAGEVFGRDPELESEQVAGAGNIIFKCVGMGIMDLVVAKMLLDMAAEKGLGTKVDF